MKVRRDKLEVDGEILTEDMVDAITSPALRKLARAELDGTSHVSSARDRGCHGQAGINVRLASRRVFDRRKDSPS